MECHKQSDKWRRHAVKKIINELYIKFGKCYNKITNNGGRKLTGPPCSVGRPRAHMPARRPFTRPTAGSVPYVALPRARLLVALQTTTDDSKQNNSGSESVITCFVCRCNTVLLKVKKQGVET